MKGEDGQMGKSTCGMGVVASAHVRVMVRGVKFLPFWCVRIN